MTNFSSDLPSFMSEDDYIELLWENGPVVTQVQSNRNRKSSNTSNFFSHIDEGNVKSLRDTDIPKSARLEPFEPIVNEFPLTDPSNNVGLNTEDDDMVPWVNYPTGDYPQRNNPTSCSKPNDFSSEFLTEFSGANLHSIFPSNDTLQTHRSNTFDQNGKSLHDYAIKTSPDGSDTTKTRGSQHCDLAQHCQISSPRANLRAGELPGAASYSQQILSGNSHEARLLKRDLTSSSKGLMNFSHFSRPVALAKASLQYVERLRSSENASTSNSIKTIESAVIQRNNDSYNGPEFLAPFGSFGTKLDFRLSGKTSKGLVSGEQPSSSVGTNLDFRLSGNTSKELVSVQQSKADGQEHKSRKNIKDIMDNLNYTSADRPNNQILSFTSGLGLGRPEIEMTREPVVASSSACSGNTGGAVSNEMEDRANKKLKKVEESDNHSEDNEDESIGLKKSVSAKQSSVKRSRAAEVHNLSERRRRDRINEKMRALQELIPNCSKVPLYDFKLVQTFIAIKFINNKRERKIFLYKVDKASLLDEAIEYLKTLQLQVQMMSMGNSLCMPPMMLPAGMQHMRMPPMPHFSQMSLGMGMGMAFGYGMGMSNLNGSTGCTNNPVPPMHGPQFRCFSPSVPGVLGVPAFPGSSSMPVLGILGQASTHAPHINSISSIHATPNLMPQVMAAENNPPRAPETIPSSSMEHKDQNLNLDMIQNLNTNGVQGLRESGEHPPMINTGDHTPHASGKNIN